MTKTKRVEFRVFANGQLDTVAPNARQARLASRCIENSGRKATIQRHCWITGLPVSVLDYKVSS